MKSTQLEIDQIINQLETDNLVQFEETILQLFKQVEANYSEENNPLAGYFGVENDDEEITFIEVLDTAIQKHLKKLSDKTLIAIFGMTYKTAGNDNYKANLIVVEEVISRKNVVTQQQIITEFYNASGCDDPGHRYWGKTVQAN